MNYILTFIVIGLTSSLLSCRDYHIRCEAPNYREVYYGDDPELASQITKQCQRKLSGNEIK